MKVSKELMIDAINQEGVGFTHAETGIKAHKLHGWTSKTTVEKYAMNPIDEVIALCQVSGNIDIIRHLCSKFGGSFTPDPVHADVDGCVFTDVNKSIRELSNTIVEITDSLYDDSKITKEEAFNMRDSWSKCQSTVEPMIRKCELGHYDGR
jgi:hypothetical protein